jgi:hypothetical protein
MPKSNLAWRSGAHAPLAHFLRMSLQFIIQMHMHSTDARCSCLSKVITPESLPQMLACHYTARPLQIGWAQGWAVSIYEIWEEARADQ